MIYGIDKGHTVSGKGTGALGILNESIEVRKIGDLVIKYLKQLGHTVIDCTVDVSNQDVTDRIIKANKQHLDLLVSIHLNAFDATAYGTEVLTANGRYMVEADRVLKNIERLGYKNRNIKDGTSPRRIGIINSTKAKAMLIECFFCDNKGDVSKYNPDTMARAIAEGITGQKLPSNTIGQGQGNSTQNTTKPKGDESIVKFEHKWQEELLIESIEKLTKQGLINNGDDWITKFKSGKLTVSELSLLSLAVSSRISENK